jgi:ornithine decarboxylase
MPDAQLLLRIFANDSSALVALGEKFGAPLETTKELLLRAKEVGLDVIGVSFHIGTSNPISLLSPGYANFNIGY